MHVVERVPLAAESAASVKGIGALLRVGTRTMAPVPAVKLSNPISCLP